MRCVSDTYTSVCATNYVLVQRNPLKWPADLQLIRNSDIASAQYWVGWTDNTTLLRQQNIMIADRFFGMGAHTKKVTNFILLPEYMNYFEVVLSLLGGTYSPSVMMEHIPGKPWQRLQGNGKKYGVYCASCSMISHNSIHCIEQKRMEYKRKEKKENNGIMNRT
jgi:hypothetical protein